MTDFQEYVKREHIESISAKDNLKDIINGFIEINSFIKMFLTEYLEPTEDIKEQFNDEIGLKSDNIFQIGALFRWFYNNKEPFQRDEEVNQLYQKLEDSDEDIKDYLNINKREILLQYFRARELLWNKLQNRDLLGNGEERRWVSLLTKNDVNI